MDHDHSYERRKKSDKAKEKGPYSGKHIRLQIAFTEKKVVAPATKAMKK
jgi:hypothetical protein